MPDSASWAVKSTIARGAHPSGGQWREWLNSDEEVLRLLLAHAISGLFLTTPLSSYAGPRDVCKLTFETEEASKPITPMGGGKTTIGVAKEARYDALLALR